VDWQENLPDASWLPDFARHAKLRRTMAELALPAAPNPARIASIAGLCWLGFAAIAVPVAQGWTQPLDEAILIGLRGAPTALDSLFIAITRLGEGPLRFALAVVGSASLFLLRQRRGAMFLLLAVLPVGLINGEMKNLFDRDRPSIIDHLVGAGGYSFPSGHAFGGTALYLGLALAFLPVITPARHRAVIASSLIIGALISFSRVWLGVHYPSDVLAGWLGGVGWVLGCYALVMRTGLSLK
jgi:undecaprenyl-diphosphatase